MSTLQIVIMGCTAVFTVLTTVIGTVWKVSQRLSAHDALVLKAMSEHQLLDNKEFSAIRSELDQSGDTIRNEFGEVGAAIRQKLHDMELQASETQKKNLELFARRESVYNLTNQISSDVKSLIEKIHGIDVKVSSIYRNGNTSNK